MIPVYEPPGETLIQRRQCEKYYDTHNYKLASKYKFLINHAQARKAKNKRNYTNLINLKHNQTKYLKLRITQSKFLNNIRISKEYDISKIR